MAEIQVNLRANERPLTQNGEWRTVARRRAATGATLGALNPLPVGNSYAKVLEITEGETQREGFFLYRAHLAACDATGSTFYIVGTTETCQPEEAVFSLAFTVDQIFKLDDRRGEVVELVTKANSDPSRPNNTALKAKAKAKTANVHPLVAGKAQPIIEHFNKAVDKYVADKDGVNSIDDVPNAVLEVFAENAEAQA